jgi:hypothetical protein
MRRTISFLIFAYLLSGCTTSKITAFRDPAFATRQFTSVAVFVHGMGPSLCIEFEKQLCRELAPTPCDSGTSLLPTTHSYILYTADEIGNYLKDRGADAILVIARVTDESDTKYFGTITDLSSSVSATASGSLNFYKNPALWSLSEVSAPGASVSVPPGNYSRVVFGQFGLFDRQSGNVVWLGKIMVGGYSIDSTTPEAFMKSATVKIARELKAAGLIK